MKVIHQKYERCSRAEEAKPSIYNVFTTGILAGEWRIQLIAQSWRDAAAQYIVCNSRVRDFLNALAARAKAKSATHVVDSQIMPARRSRFRKVKTAGRHELTFHSDDTLVLPRSVAC